MSKSIPLFHRFSKPIRANEILVELARQSQYYKSVDNYSNYYYFIFIKNKCIVCSQRSWKEDRILYVVGYIDNLFIYKITSDYLTQFTTFVGIEFTLYRQVYRISNFQRWPRFVSMPYEHITLDDKNYIQLLTNLPYKTITLDVPASS